MRTQILAKAMSGWNDGGRGERGNRRMFETEEVSLRDEDVSDLGRAFNPIGREQHEKGGDKTYFWSRGREIKASVFPCSTS